jgi:MFS family permease
MTEPGAAMNDNAPWYAGVTRSMWLVLAIASAGWIFDVYEGQIFNITQAELLSDILGVPQSSPDVKYYADVALAAFLAGGMIGGVLFGSLADRFGRQPIMILTILVYSVFSGLTYFATSFWQVAALRFLVAMGVGGEWAVAASLVSEVFPARARAHASSIFHASSIIGTWLAALAGMLVGSQWRYAYLIGVVPSLLILWVRSSVKEPENWKAKQAERGAQGMGRLRDLFGDPLWRRRAILGIALAAVGLGTFWAVTVSGQQLAKAALLREGASEEVANSHAKFAYGIVQAIGGGIGLVSFGPIAARFGRRPAFIAFQLAALAIVPIASFVPQTYNQLLAILPFYGFFTLGIHAGYAVYFPELFPTHLRATGASVCFNGGRIVAVPVLLFSGWLKKQPGVELGWALTGLASLFLVGVVIATLMPETRLRELPE